MLPADIQVIQRGWLSANQIIFHGNEFVDTVDTGFCTHQDQTIQIIDHALAKNNNKALRKIINTHLHSDHCGGNSSLQMKYHCDIYIPEAQWDAVTNWDESSLSYQELGQPCPRFLPTHKLTPNEFVELGNDVWKILSAPGHDPHSVMLFQEELGVLISADALWEKGFGAIFPELKGEGGFSEVRASLDLIEQLNPRYVIPGHGKPFSEVKEAIRYAKSRLDYLEQDPKKNAIHVSKVLIKFKLLELQSVSNEEALLWASQTPMFGRIAKLLSLNQSELFKLTIKALEQSQALIVQDDMLINHD